MRVPGHQRRSYAWRWTAALAGLAVLTSALVMALVVTPASRVEAVTYTVNSTNDVDDGTCNTTHCSLREAINAANATAATDTINFDIAGAGPHTIALTGELPWITDDNLTIDGGTSEVIIIKADGFYVGLTLDTGSSYANIRHLVFDGAASTGDSAIVVHDDTDGHEFSNLEIKGWVFDGILSWDSTSDGTTTASDNNVIMNNWIHDNGDDGVELNDGTGNAVDGNQINGNGDNGIEAYDETSLAITGNDIYGNSSGIDLNDDTNTTIDGNAGIFNNGVYGIEAANESTLTITDNEIFGNSNAQIYVYNSTTVLIQRDDFVAGSDAIVLDGASTAGVTIGGSVANRVRFRGIGAPACTSTAADCYVQLDDDVDTISVDATYNDWGTTDLGDIADLVCHQSEDSCGDGSVNYANPQIPGSSPIYAATPTSTATNTPVATSTFTYTPTVTGTPPTATPTNTPVPTATATTGPLTSVTLAANACNPVTSTYPDGTSVTTLAAAVSPSTALVSIWALQSGVWVGYSPQFPEVSQQFTVERLGVVFICVQSASTWSRPLV
jgi:CSLREA domain-containing protein